VTEREVAEQLEAELAQLSVADVLLHTASTVATLAYRRLEPADRDLEQVGLALAALEALLPLLEGRLTVELECDFRRAVETIRVAHGDAVSRFQ
jgi:hypothetical protein